MMKALKLFILFCFLLWAPRVKAQSIRANKPMTISQKRKLLAFVEDVVSIGIQRDFEKGAISNQELVRFGIYQTALRHIHRFKKGKTEGEARLASQYVTNAASEYFGKTVRQQSVGDWKYKNGYYNGYYELFEQLGSEKIKRLEVEGVGTGHLTVYADYVESIASTEFNKDVVTKIKITLTIILSKADATISLLLTKV